MTQQEIDELESVLNAYIANPSPRLAESLLPIVQQMTADFKAPALLYRDWMFIPGDKLVAFPTRNVAVLKRIRGDDPPRNFPRDAV